MCKVTSELLSFIAVKVHGELFEYAVIQHFKAFYPKNLGLEEGGREDT